MATRLPHGDEAILDIRKIEGYCLNPSHPRGRHKARVFREALDLQLGDAAWLRDVLLESAASAEASQVAEDAWGRSIWIVRTGESVLRFVTCWVL